jgi:hypothetical protein
MSDLTLHQQQPPVAIGAEELGLRTLPPSLQLLLNEPLYERVKAISALMSRAQGMTPTHLIGKGEACFSVITMALDWRLSWHFVARHTYQTPGGSIGFDGALVQSILEKSGQFIGAPTFEYRGDWSVLNGKFAMKTGQRGPGEYAAATWTDADAVGLGIIVRWCVRGENTPRVWPGENEPFWLAQCHPRNSPLWATDPKTQIRYLAIRRFANMTSPGILGGASFDRDEMLEAADLARDITPPEPRREDFARSTPAATPVTDVEEEPTEQFEVTALDGEVFGFETLGGALDAVRTVLESARRGGPKMLEAAIENNQALLQENGADLIAEFRPASPPTARTEAPAPVSTARPGPVPAEPAAAPQTSEEPAATPKPPEPEPAPSAPPAAAAAPVNDDDRFPGDLPQGERLVPRSDPTPPAASPSAAEPAGERKSMEIAPPLARGKPDWRTFVRALLIPKIRQQTDGTSLAWLLGDNAHHIASARSALDRPDIGELDQAIDAAWTRLRPQ